MSNPFALTEEEKLQLDPNYKKPRSRKVNIAKSQKENKLKIYEKTTKASRNKIKMSPELADFLCESEQESSDEEDHLLQNQPQYQTLSSYVENTRNMFLLQYALNVKVTEKTRLEATLQEEEKRVKKEENELKLAEQSFDSFLQDNDRKAMEAQRRAEHEAKLTSEDEEKIKLIEADILQLKADIYNLKDTFSKYRLYGKFLATISPEEWALDQEMLASRKRRPVPHELQEILQLEPNECLEGDNYLYFKDPQQLLQLFDRLEAENLKLIQQLQKAENLAEKGRQVSVETRTELNQQADNLEQEIKHLQQKINKEKEEGAMVQEKIESAVSGESRRGGEGKVLEDLEKQVIKIYEACVGENQARISTIDMLHHIEMKMETLTQQQESLNPEKVELARLSCERERRSREREARLENQRQMEAMRNKAALDRALAPPYRPQGRRPMFRSRLPEKTKK